MLQAERSIGCQQTHSVSTNGIKSYKTEVKQTCETEGDVESEAHQNIETNDNDHLCDKWSRNERQGKSEISNQDENENTKNQLAPFRKIIKARLGLPAFIAP